MSEVKSYNNLNYGNLNVEFTLIVVQRVILHVIASTLASLLINIQKTHLHIQDTKQVC